MKIKEVEELVGLSRSNIRFYEREGLLLVDRNNENNYREYSKEDVERINKIKTLRMLGVPTADIKRLFADEVTFDSVISDCMNRIKEQEQELKEIHKTCEKMMQKQLDIHTWDGKIEVDSKGIWKVRLDQIFSQDMIYEPIEQKKMNGNISLMLIFGYGINLAFTMIIWPLFEKYQGFAGNGVPGQFDNSNINDIYNRSVHWSYSYILILGCLAVVIFCRGIIFVTENTKIQFAIFVLNSLLLSPILLVAIQWYEDMMILYKEMEVLTYQLFSLPDIWLFWILIIIYILAIYVISTKWEEVFIKKRYILIMAAMYALLCAWIIYLKCSCFFGPFVGFLVMLEFISISWLRVNIEQEKYSRYDIFTTANFMINPLGFFIQF